MPDNIDGDDKKTRQEQSALQQSGDRVANELLNGLAQRFESLERRIDQVRETSEITAIASKLENRIGSIESVLNFPMPRDIHSTSSGQAHGCNECASSNCCCFEIVLNAVRATQMQLEPLDIAEIPAVQTALEIVLHAVIDKQHRIGIVHPPVPLSYMKLRKQLGGGPADWYNIGRVINKVYVPHNKKKSVEIFFNAVESDYGVERLIAMKDEYGSATGWITLDCCTEEILGRRVELDLTQGGTGGGIPGKIEIDFYARRCCC